MQMYDLKPICEMTHMGYDRAYEDRHLNELNLSELKKIELSTKKEIDNLKKELDDLNHGRSVNALTYPLKERISREEDYLDRVQKIISEK